MAVKGAQRASRPDGASASSPGGDGSEAQPQGNVAVTTGSERLDPDELAALEEQHHFLVRSLVDLDREFEAGDLDADDYESLRADYLLRADAVSSAIEAGRARFAAARRPRSLARVGLIVGGVAVVAVAAGVLMAQAAGRRDPGESVSGADVGGTRQQLIECFELGARGDLLEATQCYGAVLESDPENPEALAYLGWFLYRGGVQAADDRLRTDGARFVDRSIAADPEYPDPRAFKAVILRDSGDVEGALAELEVLEGLNPSPLIASLVEPLKAELEASS